MLPFIIDNKQFILLCRTYNIVLADSYVMWTSFSTQKK